MKSLFFLLTKTYKKVLFIKYMSKQEYRKYCPGCEDKKSIENCKLSDKEILLRSFVNRMSDVVDRYEKTMKTGYNTEDMAFVRKNFVVAEKIKDTLFEKHNVTEEELNNFIVENTDFSSLKNLELFAAKQASKC